MSLPPHPFTRMLQRRTGKPFRGEAAALARRRRLREMIHSGRARRKTFRISPARTAIFVTTATLLSVLLCIHLLPNRVSLRLGDLSDREIIAQRTVRYEDTEATQQLRDEAARRVDKQYEIIPEATVNALDDVRVIFDAVDRAVRARSSAVAATSSAKPVVVAASPAAVIAQATAAPPSLHDQVQKAANDIRLQAGINLTHADIQALIGLAPSARETARSGAMHLVERVMGRSITDDSSDLAQTKAELPSDAALQGIPEPLRPPVISVVDAVLTPTRRFEPRLTEQRRLAAMAAVPSQWLRIAAGTAVIRPGERVTQRHIDMFAALGLQNAHLDAVTIGVTATLIWLFVALTCTYLYLFHRDLYEDTSRLLLLAILAVISVTGLKIGQTLLGLPITGVHVGYLGMMTVASAGMAIALLISPRVAAVIVALLAVASGLILNHELRFTVITLASSLVGIVAVSSLRNRGDLLRAAVILCVSNAILNVLVGQLEGDVTTELGYGALWGIVSGLFALALFWLGIVVFEKWFGITTHLRLLELSDPATPLLQEFRMRVPGTYAHSLMVGNLAQAAAESIGADALLVRVAAYYHDLGKMNRPEFFIENQSNAENIHDSLSPSLSAIVLASHVREGLEIAEEMGLPPRVREVIGQHHGTTLMKYFYHRATGGVPNPTLEAQFRYPGPKPQTREAAILMLADGIEAASRTIERPTPSRITDFVERMVQDKLNDGQLDDCDLTLRDLKTIQDIFVRTLCGTLHARIEYPAETARRGGAHGSNGGHSSATNGTHTAMTSPSGQPRVVKVEAGTVQPSVVTLATLRSEGGDGPELTLVSSPSSDVSSESSGTALAARSATSGAAVSTVDPLASLLAGSGTLPDLIPADTPANGTDAATGAPGPDAAAVGARRNVRRRAPRSSR